VPTRAFQGTNISEAMFSSWGDEECDQVQILSAPVREHCSMSFKSLSRWKQSASVIAFCSTLCEALHGWTLEGANTWRASHAPAWVYLLVGKYAHAQTIQWEFRCFWSSFFRFVARIIAGTWSLGPVFNGSWSFDRVFVLQIWFTESCMCPVFLYGNRLSRLDSAELRTDGSSGVSGGFFRCRIKNGIQTIEQTIVAPLRTKLFRSPYTQRVGSSYRP